MTFWKRCEGELVSLTRCEYYPCINYIIVVICQEKADGFDDCDCNNLESMGSRVFVVPYFKHERKILYGGNCYDLNTRYEYDNNPTYANFEFKAVDDEKVYCRNRKAQEALENKTLREWGEKVIEVCNCCCVTTRKSKVKITYSYTYQKHRKPLGDWGWREAFLNTSCDVSMSQVIDAVHVGNNSLDSIESGNVRANLHQDENWDGREYIGNCDRSLNNNEGWFGFRLELSEDCKEWILSNASGRTWLADPYENECVSTGSVNLTSLLEFSTGRSIKTTSYPMGSFTVSGSSNIVPVGHPNDQYTDIEDLTFSATIEISPLEAFDAPEAYQKIYESLDNDLKENRD